MKRKMFAALCMVFTINLPGLVSTSATTETKVPTNMKQNNNLNLNAFDTFNDVKQRSYYFYDMISDYFEVQDFMRDIYGDSFIDSSPQYRYLTLAKKYFDRYYETNDTNDLDYGINYLYDHFLSVGVYEGFHVNYKITANEKRAYVPSNFSKDRFDTGEFMVYVGNL